MANQTPTDWREWKIDQSLKDTDTYYILYNDAPDAEFATKKDLCSFIQYCEYMMFSNYNEPHPISNDDCRDYFRHLYKYVEMMYTERVLAEQHAARHETEIISNRK
jgi:hypothetical protein